MPRAAAARLVRRDLIESASTALLARFLAPWSPFLATRNIDPLALGDSPTDATRTRLYDLLARGDTALPSDLRQELTDLDEMATLAGHDQLLAIVAERALPKLPRGLTPVDLALVARLDRQDEYRAARVRVECAGVTRYAEYEPRTVARFIAYRDGGRVESAKRALGAWFETRNRTAYCERCRTGSIHPHRSDRMCPQSRLHRACTPCRTRPHAPQLLRRTARANSSTTISSRADSR